MHSNLEDFIPNIYNQLTNIIYETLKFAFSPIYEVTIKLIEYSIGCLFYLSVYELLLSIFNMIMIASPESIMYGAIAVGIIILCFMISSNTHVEQDSMIEQLLLLYLRGTKDITFAALVVNLLSMVAYLAGVSIVVTALPGPALPILLVFAANTIILSELFYFFHNAFKQLWIVDGASIPATNVTVNHAVYSATITDMVNDEDEPGPDLVAASNVFAISS